MLRSRASLWSAAFIVLIGALYCVSGYIMSGSLSSGPGDRVYYVAALRWLIASAMMAVAALVLFVIGLRRGSARKSQ